MDSFKKTFMVLNGKFYIVLISYNYFIKIKEERVVEIYLDICISHAVRLNRLMKPYPQASCLPAKQMSRNQKQFFFKKIKV